MHTVSLNCLFNTIVERFLGHFHQLFLFIGYFTDRYGDSRIAEIVIFFDADINRLDLKSLNLTEKDYVLGGKVDLNLLNSRLSDIEGRVVVRNFRLLEDRENTYSLDSLRIWSDIDTSGYRKLEVASEALQGR